MQQLRALWRDTWWVWILLVVLVVVLAVLVLPFYWVTLAILPFIYVYFAVNRYDHEGNPKPDVDW